MEQINKNHFKNSFFVMILSVLFLVSCQNTSDEPEISGTLLDENAAVEQTEIDNISEGINAIINDTYTSEENKTDIKSIEPQNKFLTDCVTFTKEISGNTKKVTLDFGEGCTTKNEDIISGKIIMEYSFDLKEFTMNITYGFENFYFNGKKIEGSVNKVKIRINENGNPQATTTENIKVIWEDDSFVQIEGTRVREWVEGIRSGDWGDNVFLITGSWKITGKDGLTRTATIIEPLRREMSCRFIVSGKTEITRGDEMLILDYGNGTCDDLATLTLNGETKEIHLGKRDQ